MFTLSHLEVLRPVTLFLGLRWSEKSSFWMLSVIIAEELVSWFRVHVWWLINASRSYLCHFAHFIGQSECWPFLTQGRWEIQSYHMQSTLPVHNAALPWLPSGDDLTSQLLTVVSSMSRIFTDTRLHAVAVCTWNLPGKDWRWGHGGDWVDWVSRAELHDPLNHDDFLRSDHLEGGWGGVLHFYFLACHVIVLSSLHHPGAQVTLDFLRPISKKKKSNLNIW